ncbi:heavy-metal-associated domain-containing protein [Tannerella sp.]|uniref:heavy-metal-associated domain-containing protein n=1 Tax=Tannerella sp. TaxID=2382127 RepID=UPI0026DC6071|nr:heavy metal-associated domain-containing protein [Tannerella sp.]MDO4703072.1 heavy metal-associated domain-containing protein [Tannerella sp.]
MKTIQWMICCLMLLIGSDAVAQKEAKKKEAQMTFSVEIMCDHCVKNIKKNIAYEKGVKNLKIDSEKQQVTVTYHPEKTNPEKLIEAFKKIGKEATPIIEEVPLKKDN